MCSSARFSLSSLLANTSSLSSVAVKGGLRKCTQHQLYIVDCGRRLRSEVPEDPSEPKSGSANPESGEFIRWGLISNEQTLRISVIQLGRGGLTGGVLKVSGKCPARATSNNKQKALLQSSRNYHK